MIRNSLAHLIPSSAHARLSAVEGASLKTHKTTRSRELTLCDNGIWYIRAVYLAAKRAGDGYRHLLARQCLLQGVCQVAAGDALMTRLHELLGGVVGVAVENDAPFGVDQEGFGGVRGVELIGHFVVAVYKDGIGRYLVLFQWCWQAQGRFFRCSSLGPYRWHITDIRGVGSKSIEANALTFVLAGQWKQGALFTAMDAGVTRRLLMSHPAPFRIAPLDPQNQSGLGYFTSSRLLFLVGSTGGADIPITAVCIPACRFSLSR